MPPLFLIPFIVIWGCVITLGTYRRWWLFTGTYFFNQLVRRYGKRFAIGYTYAIGVGMILMGLALGVSSFWWAR